jgi:hypothetical protein
MYYVQNRTCWQLLSACQPGRASWETFLKVSEASEISFQPTTQPTNQLCPLGWVQLQRSCLHTD